MLPTRVAVTVSVLAVMMSAANMVSANEYPTRAIRIICSEPGGGNDFLARIVAPALTSALGQSVVIENRPSRLVGAVGAVANPDGYTLIIGGGSFLNAFLVEKTPYDPIKDFTGVSQLERSPNVLVVHPSLPVTSVKDLIALAKAQPGKLNYSSGASGSSSHIGAEMFKMSTGVNIVQISYRSSGPALIGVVTNETQLMFSTAGGATSQVKAGKLRALAVTSREPTALIPGVPTMIAAGVRDYDLDTIGSLLAPAKTPKAIIKRLNEVVVRTMNQPEVKEKLLIGGSEAASSTPEQLTARLVSDLAKMRKLYAKIGIEMVK
jgi:tripartite-type tricarboxylate transporter receptor subunit TctC